MVMKPFSSAVLVFLVQAVATLAQSTLSSACFPSSASSNTTSIACPPLSDNITSVSQVFWPTCACAQLVDNTTNIPFTNCTSTQTPANLNQVTFGELCGTNQLQPSNENTCSNGSQIHNLAMTACSDASDVASVIGKLCKSASPAEAAEEALAGLEIGEVVLGLLVVACKANPIVSSWVVGAICNGIDLLSDSCSTDTGNSNNHGNSTTSAATAHSQPTTSTLFWVPAFVSVFLVTVFFQGL
ncbi:hypothetical protein BDN72DRAFT_301950 [Pluteus cervinus]|uniref:Uncharacterized protein n=1 Tax=Pluteus cervinus TaxID=181527 RepID=A0ACD3B469_9AGAR|nr:hypothetical protein BDN72DRAFT_301950 [Pluteus cervinus]